MEARIDGDKAARVRRIDLSLTGVAVPAGRHEIESVYDDPWDRRGRLASRFGLAGAFLLLAAGLRRRL